MELFKAADRWNLYMAQNAEWLVGWSPIIGRYRLDHLKNMCEEELVKRVEASNAADILRLDEFLQNFILKLCPLTALLTSTTRVLSSRLPSPWSVGMLRRWCGPGGGRSWFFQSRWGSIISLFVFYTHYHYQGLLVEAFDNLARYNMELKSKLEKNP